MNWDLSILISLYCGLANQLQIPLSEFGSLLVELVRMLREGSSSLLDSASLAASILGAEWEKKSGGFNIQYVNIHTLLFSIWLSLCSAVPDAP